MNVLPLMIMEIIQYVASRKNKEGTHSTLEQEKWTNSPKIFANYYIDDAAIGVPLIFDPGNKPFVDWEKLKPYLETYGLL